MKPASSSRLRIVGAALGLIVLLAVAGGGWFYVQLRASRPQLDGEAAVAGLSDRVTIERDALGVPTLRGNNRLDVARALGFLHAQDRFFQMDLSRRSAAGELAELFGKRALDIDKAARIHGFRTLARTVLARLPEDQRAMLAAYTEGVNSGLNQLDTLPFEYLILRADPAPWTPEDSVLMVYAMTLDLQDADGEYEQSLAAVRDTLGNAAAAYFAPLLGPDDVALDGTTAPLAPMPPERSLDLRRRVYQTIKKNARVEPRREHPEVLPGSNALALGGAHTANGASLLANDMHLKLRVPNIWYRATLAFPGRDGEIQHITGVTLPGSPVIVAGSNGHVAWGFTNSFADVSDLVVLNGSSIAPDIYMRGEELLRYEMRKETIQVKGEDPETIEIPWTVWGPVVGKNDDERALALKWVAHDPEATNFGLHRMESARTVQEAIAAAHDAGIPAQNIVIADSSGAVAWTICGKLPQRFGLDGRFPVSWSFGDRGWKGFISSSEMPSVVLPPDGRIWSGNQRMLGGEELKQLGDGGYERPLRASRLREGVMALETATPADVLGVQLDIRAPHLDKWRQLLQRTLSGAAPSDNKGRRDLLAAIERWEGAASVESVSYRVVSAFRLQVIDRVLPVIFEPCYDVYPNFNFRRFHYEAALWDLVEKKPAHLLNQAFNSWDDLLLAAADGVLEEIDREHGRLSKATWGAHNTARIRHPLSGVLPGALGDWLDMPADPLPGDNEMPRVQKPSSGASERFVVAPGREVDGIFHMPGGQSGHPLSPFYRAGHDAWVRGEPTPFLPGAPIHTLVLTP